MRKLLVGMLVGLLMSPLFIVIIGSIMWLASIVRETSGNIPALIVLTSPGTFLMGLGILMESERR